MILNLEPLEPSVHPPRELVIHRNTEINTLSSVFQPVTQGKETSGAFIHGPSGSGKTCAARILLDELPDSVDDRYSDGAQIPIDTVYLDCCNGKSRRGVYQDLLDGLGCGPASARRSVATDDLKRQTREAIDGHAVVVLDEADQIGEKAVLKELFEMRGVSLLPIVNKTHHLFADIDDRLDSRLMALTPLEFKPYSESTLVEILRKRADVALECNAVGRDELEVIAARSGQDARKAISILKNAVLLARAGDGEVTVEHIEQADPMSEPDAIRSHLSALSRPKRIGLEAIARVGPATSSEIYAAYSDDPRADARTERTIRGWLSEFADRHLIRADDRSDGPVYEVREHVLEVLEVETVA